MTLSTEYLGIDTVFFISLEIYTLQWFETWVFIPKVIYQITVKNLMYIGNAEQVLPYEDFELKYLLCGCPTAMPQIKACIPVAHWLIFHKYFI